MARSGHFAGGDGPAGTTCRTRRGFTLIELLVVIAIIALLVAILVPSLRHAKMLATISVCAVRQRNMTLGFGLFHEDHERLPNVLNTYSRNAQWNWEADRLREYVAFNDSPQPKIASHSTLADGAHGEWDWIYPCGAGTNNAWMVASVPHWCAPVRAQCANQPDWCVHVGCHISRTMRQIKDEWMSRYALLSCNTSFNVSDMPAAYGEHLRNGLPPGTNIGFLDGHVEWRPIIGDFIAPHPSVWSMLRDEGNWRDSRGLWVFGYGGWSPLLPQEIHGVHPDQTNVIDAVTGWPSSGARPYWMK